jgi:class 3 adenylate cyclase
MECPSCGNPNREGARFCDSCGTVLTAATEAPAPAGAADGRPADLPESIGEGRYRIEQFLGQGGRKRVYLARDGAEDGRQVAVAVFDTEGIEETVLARARREAQAMRRLGRHPHIVAVYDTGEEGRAPYIVSELMPGGDVEAMLDAAPDRRVDAQRAISIAIDVCRALEHAHSRGIVHRDIKPANVWLGDDGGARLGDFGLATDRRSRVGVEGMLVGTVAYLPPEQALGRTSDARADLYSLGALIYEMTTGQPPFPGDDAVAIISQHLNADPVPPSRHNPDLPRALDDLVLKLLAKAPADRPEGAAAVRAELERIAASPADQVAEEVEREKANPLEGLAGGVFVGRDRELEEMRAALEDTLSGRGRLMTLVGEPGIGKTRTAEELATYAQVRGARVHWGRCHEGEGAPAYFPWAQAIRSYVREADPVGLAWELGSGGAEVARIAPEVAERLGVEPRSAEDEGEEARFRLFDSVYSFLAAASRSRPLVIVLDDLHWADASSLELLKFVARQLSGTGLLVIGTYRDVELGRHHPLARALGELGSVEGGSRIVLRGLDTPAVARFMEMTAGAEPPARLATAVWEQTEGNPFFVSEVVRLLASEGRLGGGNGDPSVADWELAIPQGVREVVGRRLDRLSEVANSVLTQTAAIGRYFELDVLERVWEGSREEMLAALDEAVAARLLTRATGKGPRSRQRLSFSHALVRETLYAELDGPQRVRLHGRIGAALAEVHAADLDPHLGEIAHHFVEAAPGGEAGRAVEYAERAGDRASAQLAHEDAAGLYGKALEVLDLCEDDPPRRLRLLLARGDAETRAGHFGGAARQTLLEAAAAARTLDDSEALARAALGVSVLSEAGNVDNEIVSLVSEALEAIEPGDSVLRVELMCGLGQELYWEDAQGKAAPLGREAVAMARRLGDDRALAAALARSYFTEGTQEGAEGAQIRLGVSTELGELAERTGDRELELRAHVYSLRDHLELGEIAAVDRELDAYARLAEELRQPNHLWHTPILRGMRALIDGRFADVERLAEEALEGGHRAEEPLAAQFYLILLAALRRHQGRMEELVAPVEAFVARYPAIPAWRTALANGYAQIGREAEARVELDRLATDEFGALPGDANWMTAIALLAETAALVGDGARAAQLHERLAPFSGLIVVAGRAAAAYGPVDRYLGLLAGTLGRRREALERFDSALELSRRMGDRPLSATITCDRAALLLDRDRTGDRERALAMLGESLEAAQELGMRGLVERALTLRLEAQGISSVDTTTSIDFVISAVESERPNLAAHAAADGTVTILFSDIENSTLMTERLGDERWLEVLRGHNAVFRRHLRAHDGFEVKNQGDGFMLAFPDPGDAVACAVAIQRALVAAEATDEERIRVRMGLHTGEAIAEEGDFFGRSVILAARIAAQACGGEILVSEALREAAAERFEFDSGRDLELKGLAGTHTVYRTEWSAESAEPEPAPA